MSINYGGVLTFNGALSSSFGLFVNPHGQMPFAKKKLTVVSVPGRNSDIIIDEGSYENVIVEYDMMLLPDAQDLRERAISVIEWLNTAKIYSRLEFSGEPNYFRLATYEPDSEMEDRFGTTGIMKARFNCRPERFLKEFEDKKDANNRVCGNNNPAFDLTSSKMFNNTTKYPAYPLIHIENQPSSFAGGTIRIQSYTGIKYTITLAAGGTQTGGVVVDCETGETFGFYNNSQIYNNKISFGATGIPRLEPRTSTISISSGTFDYKTIHMVPRLYKI